MQDDIFAQRHEQCLTIYTACTSLLAETRKKGAKVTSPTYVHPVYCSSIPSTRHMHYQTIPRTNRIWHFCQACWFKLPYQLERQESSVSASPYTHLMCQNIFNKHYRAPFTKQPLYLDTKQAQKWNCPH